MSNLDILKNTDYFEEICVVNFGYSVYAELQLIYYISLIASVCFHAKMLGRLNLLCSSTAFPH